VLTECCLHVVLGKWLKRQFQSNTSLSGQQAQATVGQAVTRVVGAIHNSIQVLPHSQLCMPAPEFEVCPAHAGDFELERSVASSFSSLAAVRHSSVLLHARQAYVGILANDWPCLQIPLAVMVLTDASVASHTMYGSTPLSTAMIGISVGYFWHDLITCLRRCDGVAYTLHAVLCLVVFTYALHTGFLHYYGAFASPRVTCLAARLAAA
jgi:hypothetical protein